MFLHYKAKKDKEKILSMAKSYNDIFLDEGMSYLIKGENMQVLSGLLEQFNSKIDLIYIDPPYNTNRVFKITDSRQNTISSSSEGEIAYSDNMSQDEYFEFMRERLIILRELLSDRGSIYVHIDYKIGHYIKVLMDEIFGMQNFKNDISRIKSNPKNFGRKAYGNQKDMILFYAKNKNKNIFNNITEPLTDEEILERFKKVDCDGRRYTTVPVHAPGETRDGVTGGPWKGMLPPEGRHWRYSPEKLDELDKLNLIEWSNTGNPRLKNYADEHKGKKVQDIWEYKDPGNPSYPTEKNIGLLSFIIEQSSLKDSYVLDCFAGSGTTLKAANKLDRKWIGIDNSEHAIRIAKKRLENINYNYLEINNSSSDNGIDIEEKNIGNEQLKMI